MKNPTEDKPSEFASIVGSTEDYHSEDGLLYCGKCHTPKEAFFAKGIVLLGKNRHPVECACCKVDASNKNLSSGRRSTMTLYVG